MNQTMMRPNQLAYNQIVSLKALGSLAFQFTGELNI